MDIGDAIFGSELIQELKADLKKQINDAVDKAFAECFLGVRAEPQQFGVLSWSNSDEDVWHHKCKNNGNLVLDIGISSCDICGIKRPVQEPLKSWDHICQPGNALVSCLFDVCAVCGKTRPEPAEPNHVQPKYWRHNCRDKKGFVDCPADMAVCVFCGTKRPEPAFGGVWEHYCGDACLIFPLPNTVIECAQCGTKQPFPEREGSWWEKHYSGNDILWSHSCSKREGELWTFPKYIERCHGCGVERPQARTDSAD